jgi:uncharacterized membrane protein
MESEEVMEVVSRAFEAVGVAIIVFGGLFALVHTIRERPDSVGYFAHARRRFGLPLILGLEVLIAADIIKTITIDPSLESAAALGVLVLIRILLSFSLDVEIDGMWPWKRAASEKTEALEAARAD